jgi:hypothetical protein
VLIASILLQPKRRMVACFEPPVITSEPRSLNDLPDEILLIILSHLGPEELCLNIPKVCKKWNNLAKDVLLWKTLSYKCDRFSDINRIAKVRCTALLVFRTNYLTNFVPSSDLKLGNIKKSISVVGLFVRQVCIG